MAVHFGWNTSKRKRGSRQRFLGCYTYCAVVVAVVVLSFVLLLLPVRSVALVVDDSRAVFCSNQRLLFSKSICNQRSSRTVVRKMALLSQQEEQGPPPGQQQGETPTVFRVLTLHGSEGTAAEFTLDDWKTSMKQKEINWQVTSLQAPFPKGSGYAWWKLAPNERSFTAQRYEGFETSAELVQEAMSSSSSSSSSFDVLVGHSQGAILLTALLALGRLDDNSSTSGSTKKPQRRILLNGVAWPNPFGQQLAAAARNNNNNSSSSSSSTTVHHQHHDILLIIGERDRINPPEQARRVQRALEQAGHVVQVLKHPAGHSLPQDAASLRAIEEWMFRAR